MNKHRPIYHFQPEKNWMNDPNGPIYYKGEYHLFYQHNPNDDKWGTIHWGHAKSKDLVYWEHLPLALYPSTEKGEDHCFSGCTVVKDGIPTIFYTSIGPDKHPLDGADQWMAVSSDDMMTWKKVEENPILTSKIHGDYDIQEWRDPYVWQEGDQWYMVIGGKLQDHGCAVLYTSEDLYNWRFVGILATGTEEIWECPNVFSLKGKQVLLYSPSGPVRYRVGNIDKSGRFQDESRGTFDFSGWEGFYAPNSLEDENGHRIIIGWLTENARGDLNIDGEWAGVQSIPRTVSLDGNRLLIQPITALQKLRYNPTSVHPDHFSKDHFVIDHTGRAHEIEATFYVHNCHSAFQVTVLESPDQEEQTAIEYDAETETLTLNRSKSSQSKEVHRWNLSGELPLPDDGMIHLRIFVDHSTIEVFANGHSCVSSRVFPLREDSVHVGLKMLRGDVRLRSWSMWDMKSIWN